MDDLESLLQQQRLDYLNRSLEQITNFGRGYSCFLESVFTPGRARLPRKLKKAVKRYMAIHKITSMVITPKNQFVCIKHDGRLLVCHAKY